MYRSGNVALNESTFQKSSYPDKPWWEAGNTSVRNHGMTIEGVTEKGAVTFLLFITSGMTIWGLGLTGQPEAAITLFFAGFVLNAVFSIILFLSWFTTSFQGLFANPLFVLTYATSQGLFIGGITFAIEHLGGPESGFQGITIQAFLITGMIFGAMLGVYRSGLINVNHNFRIALYSAVFGIMMVYLLSFILLLFGVSIPLIHGSGPIGIIFSLLVIALGAGMLASDFDFIERGVENGAPKELEWRAVFGLTVTLIWIYLEVLNLLMKLQQRR